MEPQSNTNTNTMLIVVVLLLLVGFGVWWFARTPAAQDTNDSDGTNVQIELGGDSSDTTPADSTI